MPAATATRRSTHRQDGRFGRDSAKPFKAGGGAAAFDLTKVCMDGRLDCTGTANVGANPLAGEWACTKDNITNLIWSLESGQGDWTTYARTTLPAATNVANRCGYSTGWRLPTRRELMSIVHLGQINAPGIDSDYFPATPSAVYWVNEPIAGSATLAWGLSFAANSGATTGNTTSVSRSVRLVRSGP